MKRNRRSVSIASDDRARIPFAVVGVLLLLSSVAVVTVLQSRAEPQRDVDPSVALDRSEAVTQSAIKAAALDATDRVAASPVTEPATAGEFAELLGDADTGSDAVFRNYAALMVYKSIYSRVNGTTHAIRNDTTATVSLPSIDDRADAADAMDRVTFEAGYETSERERGTVRLTISDVTYNIREAGDHVATRSTDVSVVVATPLFQIHERVQTYQDRLEMDMTDGAGFEGIGREFAARTYPVVIAKSMFNYARGSPRDAPIQQIVPEKQTELLLNHANYAVQSKTFKTRDPLWDRPTKSNTLCWLAWEADQNYDGTADNSSVLPTPENSSLPESGDGNPENYEYFCRGSEFLFGDSTGTPGEVPSLWDIISGELSEQDVMRQTENASYALFAEQAYVDLHPDVDRVNVDVTDVGRDDREEIERVTNDPEADGLTHGELDDVFDTIYRMGVDVETSGTDAPFDVDHTCGDDWSFGGVVSTEYTDRGEDATVIEQWRDRDDPSDTDPDLFAIHLEDTVTKTDDYTCLKSVPRGPSISVTRTSSDTATHELDVSIRGEFDPDATVTIGGDSDFTAHSGDVRNLFTGDNGVDEDAPRNFDLAPESAFVEAFDVPELSDDPERDLESILDGTAHESTSGTWATLGNPGDADGVSLGPDSVTSTPSEVRMDFAKAALETVKDCVLDEGPREYQRSEFLTGNPFQDMEAHLAAQHADIVYDDDDPFTGMPNYLRTEIRHRYHQAAIEYTDDASEKFDDVHSDLTDKIDGDTVLDDGVDLAQDAVNRDPPSYGGSMETADLLGSVSFEVRGSPTYLEFDSVNRSEVPAVRPAGNVARNLTGAEDVEHVAASGCTNNRIGYFGLPVLPWPSGWVVTTSSWGVEVKGEYARFEVTANVSDPSRVTSLTYVREDKAVSTTIGNETARLGSVDPITIDTYAEFPMIVPSGKAGTGDPAAFEEVTVDEPTAEWDYVGPGYDPEDGESDSEDSC